MKACIVKLATVSESTGRGKKTAQKAGVTPKMVRHYESLGLLPKVHRTDSGLPRV